ncbi:tripartite motif-containing protein 16-like protein [Xyrauchen texanus]|uniref:tripartite motif-containing protein 16-like protein n=1 Tax=Xyrauchen texanus TaxID=154827 RepID=UPI002241A6D3|nr:tripartite motif-containing protein 16-like protein [Xyrauchen texanus]
MAEANISVALDHFCCPVCLDLLKDPVTIPCGHSYCMNCITDCWNREDLRRIYRCPQCRQTFTTRPALSKNIMLAEMVDELKTRIQATRPADVECDVCTGRKQKAVKSCQECQNSYCQNHLEQHEMFFRGKRHNLTDVNGRLQETTQPQYNMLEMLFQTDLPYMMCMLDDLRSHETAVAAAEKQKQVREIQSILHPIILQKEKDAQDLREAVTFHKRSAHTAVEDCELNFTELISSIERSRSEVTQLIRDQENAAVSRAEELLEQLEQEIDDLRRRDAGLMQLSHTDLNPILQSFQTLSLSGSTENSNVTSHLSYDNAVKSVSQLKDKLQHLCREETEKMSAIVKNIQIILTPEYKTRREFLQYFHQFTLDPNTVNLCLCLSEGNRRITYTETHLRYPDHPDRFDRWTEVLCSESMDGRCYCEVEWSGIERLGVDIAVAYKSIKRKGAGPECSVGRNDQSWSLFCSPSYYSFWHNNIETILPVVHSSSKVGVYVNHKAGILSFYSVSQKMSLIHRLQTTFTQPLYPMFGLDKNTTVKLCFLGV